jgi:hypothetical protein
MTPEEAARRSARGIVEIPSRFMLDGATYRRGGELGFSGVDFYIAGRGGALGDVEGSVVAAAFVFFNPGVVVTMWDATRPVMPRRAAAEAFAGCGHSWAEANLPQDVDYARMAGLLGRVIDTASPAAVPLFAAWASVPEPSAPSALALHRLNVARELRGGLHGAAVVAHGLEPLEAVMVRAPAMAPVFGWSEPLPDPEPCRAAWDRAESATNAAMARAVAVLDDAERGELVELVELVDLLAGAGGSAP